MSIAPARSLPHFNGIGLDGPQPQGPFRSMTEAATAPPPDDTSEVQRAIERALDDANKGFETERAADLAEFERRLHAREREIANEAAAALAERLCEGLRRIDETIATRVAEILGNFLDKAVRERALAELSETLAALLADGKAVQVKIKGPAELIEPLRKATSTAGKPIDTQIADGPDVQVMIDETLIETSISAWMDRLRAAIAGDADV